MRNAKAIRIQCGEIFKRLSIDDIWSDRPYNLSIPRRCRWVEIRLDVEDRAIWKDCEAPASWQNVGAFAFIVRNLSVSPIATRLAKCLCDVHAPVTLKALADTWRGEVRGQLEPGLQMSPSMRIS